MRERKEAYFAELVKVPNTCLRIEQRGAIPAVVFQKFLDSE